MVPQDLPDDNALSYFYQSVFSFLFYIDHLTCYREIYFGYPTILISPRIALQPVVFLGFDVVASYFSDLWQMNLLASAAYLTALDSFHNGVFATAL